MQVSCMVAGQCATQSGHTDAQHVPFDHTSKVDAVLCCAGMGNKLQANASAAGQRLQANASAAAGGVTSKLSGLTSGFGWGGKGAKLKDEPASDKNETELTSADGTPGVTTRRRAAAAAPVSASPM